MTVKVEDAGHLDDPTNITATSAHCFPDYIALNGFFKQYAASRGFETRIAYNGGVKSAMHAGSVKCWCWEASPTIAEEETKPVPSHPSKRNVQTATSLHGGKQVKCGCKWVVKFCRREDGKYWLTSKKGSRVLVHDHVLLQPAKLVAVIDSLLNVSPELEQRVRGMIVSGMHVGENERRYLESEHGFVLDRDLYHNLIKKIKKDLGMIDSTADFDGLLEWLQSEQRGRGAVARMRLAGDRRVNGVVYMSTDMLHHLESNGQVLLMDTTFKTNRFHCRFCSCVVWMNTIRTSSLPLLSSIIKPPTRSSGFSVR